MQPLSVWCSYCCHFMLCINTHRIYCHSRKKKGHWSFLRYNPLCLLTAGIVSTTNNFRQNISSSRIPDTCASFQVIGKQTTQIWVFCPNFVWKTYQIGTSDTRRSPRKGQKDIAVKEIFKPPFLLPY